MRTRLLLLILICQSSFAFAQSDLLVLKKRNHTIQTWVKGSFIDFQFSSKQWIKAEIKDLRNDSLLLHAFVLRIVASQFGLPVTDTGWIGLMKIHVQEIYGIPLRDRSGIITNGSLFQLGSAGYGLLNIANSLIQNDQVFSAKNVSRLGIAAGVFGIGTLLAATHKTQIVMGKKYKMELIHIAQHQ